MSRTSILAIFAAAGIAFTGAMTPDAMALARAISSGDMAQLQRFITQYPASPYKPEAVRLACETNWVNGACGSDSDLKGINNGNSSSPPAKSGYASG